MHSTPFGVLALIERFSGHKLETLAPKSFTLRKTWYTEFSRNATTPWCFISSSQNGACYDVVLDVDIRCCVILSKCLCENQTRKHKQEVDVRLHNSADERYGGPTAKGHGAYLYLEPGLVS